MSSIYRVRATVLKHDRSLEELRVYRVQERDADAAVLEVAARLADEGLDLQSRITSVRYMGETADAPND
jgi:hypothetical protein